MKCLSRDNLDALSKSDLIDLNALLQDRVDGLEKQNAFLARRVYRDVERPGHGFGHAEAQRCPRAGVVGGRNRHPARPKRRDVDAMARIVQRIATQADIIAAPEAHVRGQRRDVLDAVGAQAQIGQPCQVLQRRDIRNPVAIQIQRSQPGKALQGRDVGNAVVAQIQRFQPCHAPERREIRNAVAIQGQKDQPGHASERGNVLDPVAVQVQIFQPGQVAQRGHVHDPVVPQPQIGQPGQALQGREVGNVVFVQIQEVQPGRVFQPRQIDDVLIVGGQPRQVRQFGAGDRLAPMLVQFPLKHRAKVGVGDVAVSVPVCARAASGNARGGISAVF